MRKSALIVVTVAAAAAFALTAQAAPGLRAYYGDPTAGIAVNTDAGGQWNLASILPSGLAPSLTERILSLSSTDTASNTIADFAFSDADGLHGRFWLGRPLHPGTHNTYDADLVTDPTLAGYDGGRVVRMIGTGLTGIAGAVAPDRNGVRFHVLEPGASHPMAYATQTTDSIPDRAKRDWMTPAGGDVADPTRINPNVTSADNWKVHVNPSLVSDGDQWTILQGEEYCLRTGGGDPYRVVIMVYSRQSGWDFYMDTLRPTDNAVANVTTGNPGDMAVPQSWSIVTNSGALRIECPRLMRDINPAGNDGNPTYRVDGDFFTRRITFTVSANGSLVPKPADMLPPLDPTNDTPAANPIGAGTWSEALRAVTASLPSLKVPYLAGGSGSIAVWDRVWEVPGAFTAPASGLVQDIDAVQFYDLTSLPAVVPIVPFPQRVAVGGMGAANGVYTANGVAGNQVAYQYKDPTANIYKIQFNPAVGGGHWELIDKDGTTVLSSSAAFYFPNQGWTGGASINAAASPLPILQGRVGRGLITVQARRWHQNSITAGEGNLQQRNRAGSYCYYRTGAEWQDATNGTLSNANIADATVGNAVAAVFTAPLQSPTSAAFISSRLKVAKTGNTWTHGDNAAGGTVEVLNSGYPRVVVGTVAGGVVTNPEFAPGSTTPARSFSALNLMPGTTMHRCRPEVGGCGAVFVGTGPATCPYCGTDLTVAGAAVNAGPGASGVYGAALQAAGLAEAPVTALTTVPGLIDNPSHFQRFAVPDSAVRFGPADLFPVLTTDSLGSTVNGPTALMPPGATPINLTVQVDVPRFQTPSVPAGGQPWINNYGNDQGYAGSRMIFNDLSASTPAGSAVIGPNAFGLPVGAVFDALPPGYDGGNTPGVTSFAGNGRWDQYYRCPDCGRMHPGVPGCPLNCVVYQYSGAGIAYNLVPAACPGHRFCTVCGNSVTITQATAAGNVCPFCGGSLTLIPAAGAGALHVMSEDNLEAEEFDTFDVQVSVARKVEVATDQPAVDLGRVSPGVSAVQPDTTVGSVAAWQMPFGADASLPVPTSSGNAGNVLTPVRPSYMPAGGGFAADTQVLSRADMDPARYLREGLMCLNPIYIGSVSATSTGTYFVGGNLTPRQADLSNPGNGSPYGLNMPSQEPGTPMAASNWMFWQAGNANPLALGLPVGAYRGQMYTFVDLYGDGYLRFWRKSIGAIATTQTMPFDPEYDIPLQPVTTYGMQTRVTESRLPANDYYANDSSPTARFIQTGIGGGGTNRYLQTIWTTNRANTGALNATVAASTSPVPSTTPYPYNLVYTTTPPALVPDNFNPFRDGYGWISGTDARAITSDAAAASASSINSAPSTLTDSGGNQWLVWYRHLNHAGGTQSTFEYAPADSAAGFPFGWTASGHIYSTGLPKEHLRGFVEAGTALQWYFWDSGTGIERNVWYRWRRDPASTVVDNHESVLPIANGIGPDVRGDFATASYTGGDGHSVRKPSHSPFVYTATPCPLEMSDGASNLVSVFFSGYARSTQTSDICWVQYDRDQLALPANWRANNFGKRAFARITDNTSLPRVEDYAGPVAMQHPGEQFRGDGLRQVFNSRHLDWQVQEDAAGNDFGRNYISSGAANDRTSWNPKFYLGVVTDNRGDGVSPGVSMYMLTWTSPRDTYDRRRGTYTVIPTLVPVNGAPAVNTLGGCVLPGGQLSDPNAAASGRAQPVTLEIDPAAGTLRFSAPLFNADNSADPTCVFNSTSLSVNPALADVLVYGSYTPYVYRVTNAGGADDCPNAFWQGGAAQRLLVFWRRNYSTSQAPAAGRSAVMYKTWSTGVSLDHPPVAGLGVRDNGGNAYVPIATDAANGRVAFPAAEIGNQFIFSYNGPDGAACAERHLVLGWSNEMPVPISSVTAESSALTVTPESYQPVVMRGGSSEILDNTRYWLFWSSPRAIFDLRTAGNGQAIHQSGDIFSATVRLQPNNLSREVDTGTVDFNTPT